MRKNKKEYKMKDIKFKYILILFLISLLILQFVVIPTVTDKFKRIVTSYQTITQQR